jgi:hypothetical protein
MSDYNTLGYNLKRGIFNFCAKLSKEFNRPVQKFIASMVYGLLAAQSCNLTEIARKLKEKIKLDNTVERLSRNLADFDGADELHRHYIEQIKGNFDESTILIIDDSDISKPYSSKLEGLCKVRDGSTGEIADGYWYAGISALSSGEKQPIPVYSRIYSSVEEGYLSNNAETLKSLAFLSSHFPKTQIRALDAGYDAGYIFKYFIPRKESFIVRTYGNRNCLYKGKKILISDLAKRFKGKHLLNFRKKNGKKTNCKISAVTVSLPDYPDVPLNLVICNGLGKEALLLLTNLESNDNRLGVTIAKVYLMRWRIEEYYRFKKQGFGFEKFLVRSLKDIRNLDLLLTIATGYIGILSETIKESIEIFEIVEASKRLYGLTKFTFYAIADGLYEVFSKLHTGIRSFFDRPPRSNQLCLPGAL